jgi:uncharacterized protein
LIDVTTQLDGLRAWGKRERVAVVGSGVAGLTAAYLLQRRYDVVLYEADSRLGGHAHTHDVVTSDAGAVAIDTGFIVHNTRTYPHLMRLFGELGVATQPTEMSMSVHCDGCGLEYAGAKGLGGLFAQPRSLRRGRFLTMLMEVKRFHRGAHQVLASGHELTLGRFLAEGCYSSYFVRHFVIPLVSCVWSTSQEASFGYPARYLFSFLDNHGMLSVTGSPTWRTVVGGSRRYVERAAKELTSTRLATPVRSIERGGSGIRVRDDDDTVETYARVVVATHADTALMLLERPTADERRALGAFRYSHNLAVLHTDERALPQRRRARSSWNYLMSACATSNAKVAVSYDMTRLQHLPTAASYVVSLNPSARIDRHQVVAEMDYTHPIYDVRAVTAQRLLPGLNDGRIAFAGAYHGWGFHEDGCRSGAAAARSFGVDWESR